MARKEMIFCRYCGQDITDDIYGGTQDLENNHSHDISECELCGYKNKEDELKEYMNIMMCTRCYEYKKQL